MSIRFFPLGLPISSSFATTASMTLSTLSSNFPVSASYAEFTFLPVGPSGSDGTAVSGSVP